MSKKKSPKGIKRAAKVSKRQQQQTSERVGAQDALEAMSLLNELPLDVRRMLLGSILGEENAEELIGNDLIEDRALESPEEAKTRRLLERADAAQSATTRRNRLQEVVKQNPDCVEGWTKLAECQDRPEQAIPFYEQAIAAAERALPEASRSRELDRHDDGVRTYIWTMRNLMECFKAAHRLNDAITVGQEILRREPDDHTATRHSLLGLLLEAGRHQETESLLETYPDEAFAEWAFGRLLLAIQTQATQEKRLQILKQAHTKNPYVIDYLLGRLPMPVELPPLVELGESSGAIFCAFHLRKAWVSTPGAISWLREAAGKAKLLTPEHSSDWPIQGSGGEFNAPVETDVFNLPLHPEPIWVAGIHELPPIHRQGKKRKKKVWALYAFAANGPISCEICEQRPKAANLWAWLLETMCQEDPPGRPERITFPQKGICRQLRLKAIRVGVDIEVCEDPPPIEPLFEKLAQQIDWESQAQNVSGDDILALPQDPTDCWQCDLTPLGERLINDRGERQRAVSILVASARDNLVLAQEISTTEPDDKTLLKTLQQAMMIPLVGESHRPAEVVVRHEDDRLLLQKTLGQWSINVRVSPQLDVIDQMQAEMSGLFKTSEPGGLHSDPEITHDDRAAFYESACRLFQSRPWQRWQEDDVIRIECDAIKSKPFYALVMGQSGIETGLSLFEDRRIPEQLFQGAGEEVMRDMAGYSLTYGEEQSLPVPDLDAIEQFGWPIATPEAYPVLFRINQGPAFAPVNRTEVRLLTALMDALDTLAPRADSSVVATCQDVTVSCTYDGQTR